MTSTSVNSDSLLSEIQQTKRNIMDKLFHNEKKMAVFDAQMGFGVITCLNLILLIAILKKLNK